MGCINSSRRHGGGKSEHYVETLTLKRHISRKKAAQNLEISISVIADPQSDTSATESSSTLTYRLQRSRSDKNPAYRTMSFVEGRKYTKFPNMVGYKMCVSCNEPKKGVLRMNDPDIESEICRKCSVHHRKASRKLKHGRNSNEHTKTNTNAKSGGKGGEKNVEKRNFDIEKLAKEQRSRYSLEETSKKVDIAAFASLLALTALDLTAPASDAILKNRKNTWIQLAGHPGSFAPAGPNTIWKKRCLKDNNETEAYESLMEDTAYSIVPMFYREVEYNSEYFIEIEDLLQHFTDPNIMDIKMGTRTFLESEVRNSTLRKDLFEKMIALDPDAPSEEEQQTQSITKLRYMQFREQESSTAEFGFRIEALRISGEPPSTNLKRVKNKEQIHGILAKFLNNKRSIQTILLERLEEIAQKVHESAFFMSHELVGSSLLMMYDKLGKCGIWVIDFSKTNLVTDCPITHRKPWSLGNHEDGFLFGIDHLIQFFSEIETKEDLSSSVNSTSQTTTDT